jgi:hypothetical protein
MAYMLHAFSVVGNFQMTGKKNLNDMPSENAPEQSPGCASIIMGFVGILLNLLLLVFVSLRETPHFWLNSGGYPVVLRAVVYWLYYPLLVIDITIVTLYTISLSKKNGRQRSHLKTDWGIAVFLWLLILGILFIQMYNNIDNWIHHRPMHSH